MQKSVSILSTFIASALAFTLIGCDNKSNGSGTLNLDITDAPVDSAEHVYVEFSGVEIKAADGETIVIEYATPKHIDLLALTGGVAENLVENQILPAGQIEWIRLLVNASEGGDPTDDSYIVIDEQTYELRIPSGAQSGLKLNRPISIAENGVASFTIDFDLRKSVHERSGNVYQLRPTLRLIDNHSDGALNGTIDSNTISTNCVDGDTAAVYVYAGNVTANDVGSAVEPITSATVDWVNANNAYSIAFIPFGVYTVAFTCDAGMDNPETDDDVIFIGSTTIEIVAGQTTTQNF